MSMLLGGPTFPGPRANAGRGAGRAGWWIGALLRALWAPVASADEPPAPAPDAAASAPMAQITYDRTPDQAPIQIGRAHV